MKAAFRSNIEPMQKAHSARPWCCYKLHNCKTLEECEANAKLIAAALELLETLIDIKSQIPVLWGDKVIDDKIKITLMANTIDRIEQAIKKATE